MRPKTSLDDSTSSSNASPEPRPPLDGDDFAEKPRYGKSVTRSKSRKDKDSGSKEETKQRKASSSSSKNGSKSSHKSPTTKTHPKSDQDLYKDLLADIRSSPQKLSDASSLDMMTSSSDTAFSSSSNLNQSLSILDMDFKKTVLIDYQAVVESKPKSPGNTGHERKSQFTFCGEMLQEDQEEDDEPEFFDEEEDDDGLDQQDLFLDHSDVSSEESLDFTSTMVVSKSKKSKPTTAKSKSTVKSLSPKKSPHKSPKKKVTSAPIMDAV